MKRIIVKTIKKPRWTGTTGGEIIKQNIRRHPKPHEIAESEEKEITEKYQEQSKK